MKDTSHEVQELARAILRHKALYYSGTPEISDSDFDALEAKLAQLSPDHPVLQEIGAVAGSGEKIEHRVKMLSLNKTYALDELEKWIDGREVVSYFKIDGISASLIYRDGQLVSAATRGDGAVGENILSKVQFIEDIPKSVNDTGEFEIRGEIFCYDEQFLELSETMVKLKLARPSSQRNVVAGLLGRKENVNLCTFLSFKAFDLINYDEVERYQTEVQKIEVLGSLLPNVVDSFKHSDSKTLKKHIDDAESFLIEGDFQIDGLVFTLNQIDLHRELGSTAHHPRYKIAFKYEGTTATTKLSGIDWQVSRNGVLTPVGIVEPVELSGAQIQKVSLHNYGQVKAHNLKKDDEIEIIRSGEVIPKYIRTISESTENFEVPDDCPSCATKLSIEDIRLICNNSFCPAKILEEIVFFVKTIGIDDVSTQRIKEMIEKGLIKEIPDLFRIQKEDFFQLDKVKEKLAKKMYENINRVKNPDLATFLTSLGIKGGGKTTNEKLVEAGYRTFEQFKKLKFEDLIQLDGFAEKSSQTYIESLKSKIPLAEKLFEIGFKLEKVQTPAKNETGLFSGKKVAITGKLSRKRSEIEKAIKAAGGSPSSSVTSQTDFLITNDPTSGSSKIVSAKKHGVPLLTEDEFYVKLAET